jgi:hypothetical protein
MNEKSQKDEVLLNPHYNSTQVTNVPTTTEVTSMTVPPEVIPTRDEQPKESGLIYFMNKPIPLSNISELFKRMEFSDPQTGNLFFEIFGPGVAVGTMDSLMERPYERFRAYEQLLIELQKADPQKYKEIHKGTPFFFLAWTGFGIGNYEKALFYLDAAISEDLRANKLGWLELPAAKLLTFKLEENHSAKIISDKMHHSLAAQLTRFNTLSGLSVISPEKFIDKFVVSQLRNPLARSVITALYTFLLEFNDLHKELFLRSVEGGSAEPFITHLFKGGLIFESLLKSLYPDRDDGKRCRTIEDIVNRNSNFAKDFGIKIKTSADTLREIFDGITGKDIKNAFDTTAQLRNTTGHNLVWADVEDVLGDPERYRVLFEQEVNAIIFIAAKKFLY